MHYNRMLAYGALSSLINSKINFWKYKKYCALNISECWEAYSKLPSLPRRKCNCARECILKKQPLQYPGRVSLQIMEYGCPKIPDCPHSVGSRKGGENTHVKPILLGEKCFHENKNTKTKTCHLSLCISLVSSPVYQKCSLGSIIAQITFKQMSEGPLFVWLKLSENTTHFKTSLLQYRLIKNKPSTLCFPILILMNISLWVSSGISLRSDLHGVAADSWYMQSCKTQTQNKSPKGKHSAGFPRKKQIKELLEMFSSAGLLKWPFPSQKSGKGCGQDGTWGLRSRREGCFISFCWCLDDCALSRASSALWKAKQGHDY